MRLGPIVENNLAKDFATVFVNKVIQFDQIDLFANHRRSFALSSRCDAGQQQSGEGPSPTHGLVPPFELFGPAFAAVRQRRSFAVSAVVPIPVTAGKDRFDGGTLVLSL